jgi:predicted nucleic acid-binding protein
MFSSHPLFNSMCIFMRLTRRCSPFALERWKGASAEFYAVLTRAPFSLPVFPLQAWQALAENFLPAFEVVPLSTEDYKSAIHLCARHGWAGGRIYNLLHIASANKAGCERIFTFNVRHFQQLAPEYGDRISAPY